MLLLNNQEAQDKLLSYKVGVRHSDYLLAKASISQAMEEQYTYW